jgi:hypothetical protein
VSWYGNGVAVCGRGALVLYSVLRPRPNVRARPRMYRHDAMRGPLFTSRPSRAWVCGGCGVAPCYRWKLLRRVTLYIRGTYVSLHWWSEDSRATLHAAGAGESCGLHVLLSMQSGIGHRAGDSLE